LAYEDPDLEETEYS